jgi:hypothetical protein
MEDLGLICAELGLQIYSSHGATVAAGTFHAEKVERGAARVAGSRGMPATGLRPRPAREKGFPSNLLFALIDTSPLLIKREFLDP